MVSNDVVSATTRVGRGLSKRDGFLLRAQDLIAAAYEALAQGDTAEALEWGYQAALRTAGARIAGSPKIAKRKRLPSSAWDRLALVDEAGAAQAARFRSYSHPRSRVRSGIAASPELAVVEELLAAVDSFLLDAEAEAGWHQDAA